MMSENELKDRDPKLLEILKGHNEEYERTQDVCINDLILAVYTYSYDKGYANGFEYGCKCEGETRTNSPASDKKETTDTTYVYSLRAQCEQLAKEVENQAQEIIEAREIQEELEKENTSLKLEIARQKERYSDFERELDEERRTKAPEYTAYDCKQRLEGLGYIGKLTKVETLIVGDYEDEVVAKTKA